VAPTLKIFPDNPAVATSFAKDFAQLIQSLLEHQGLVSVALSGGSTPKLLFDVLANEYANRLDWSNIHFFWGDERCVPPTDPESNYGEAERLLLSRINIPAANVHRMMGESDPELERVRYEQEWIGIVKPDDDGLPKLDILILGMGSDGHTASIFPNQIEFMHSNRICEIATHPESGQKRITLTGPVLNAAANVFFLVTGESKAKVLGEIFHESGQYKSYPATHIAPAGGSQFYVDELAGALI
jgi:6-phosphogluconolactonase